MGGSSTPDRIEEVERQRSEPLSAFIRRVWLARHSYELHDKAFAVTALQAMESAHATALNDLRELEVTLRETGEAFHRAAEHNLYTGFEDCLHKRCRAVRAALAHASDLIEQGEGR